MRLGWGGLRQLSAAAVAVCVCPAVQASAARATAATEGRGDAYYRGGLEPMPAGVLRQPDTFDPLAAVLRAARPAGLGVHAWINLNLVSSAVELPASREHLIYRHPDWLMVPRDIAQDLAASETNSPGDVGKLAGWTRTQSAAVEGLYASPLFCPQRPRIRSRSCGIATRYALDADPDRRHRPMSRR